MTALHQVTLAILAGGKGSRIGKPKGLLTVNGRPILEFLLDRLNWPGPTMLVTAPGRENPPGAPRFCAEVCDPVAGVGPLRGILTALENASTPLVVVTAVDMPLVESAHLRGLVEQIHSSPDLLGLMTQQIATAAMPGQVQPLPAIFRTEAAACVRERLESRALSVGALTQDPRFAALDLGWDPTVWLNINGIDDVERISALGLLIV